MRRLLPLAFGLLLFARPSAASTGTVSGKLEWVSCDSITGWADDSSAATTPVAVELSFDAPLASKPDGAFTANLHRDDLCASLGSCEHGFDVAPPYSLYDGQPHDVHVYADDVAQTGNVELESSPATLLCDAPAVTGMKRRLSSAAAMVNWRFNVFWHAVALDDTAIDLIHDGPALPSQPALARADDGTPDVWLVDGSLRRKIADASVMMHWRFAADSVQTRAAADLYALTEGPPLRSRPMLVQSSLDELFLIDEELPLSASDPTDPVTPPPQNSGDVKTTPQSACAARVAHSSGHDGAALSLGAALLALALTRRRRG